MLIGLTKTLGWLLANLPLCLVELKCKFWGDIMFILPTKRRRILLSNLHHAFPEKTLAWHRKIGRESCRRTVEMGLLALALPYFSIERLRRHFRLSVHFKRFLEEEMKENDPGPLVAMVPHFSMLESLTVLPVLSSRSLSNLGAVFRPFNNVKLDLWIKQTRERWGVRLFSRKKGFNQSMALLRKKGYLSILFDQEAGKHGVLMTFLGRVCSTSTLPGLLSKKFDAKVCVFFAERKSFWKAELEFVFLETAREPVAVTLAANAWLENRLRESDHLCADWLWLHDRWHTQCHARNRLRLEAKKSILPETMAFYGYAELPRKTRIWIRLPNWLGDVVMTIPLLRAIRKNRPDAEITLLVKASFIPFLEKTGVADRLLSLPPKGFCYFWYFLRLRREYPDTHILFTNSFRGDLEARLIKAPQRFGMLRPGKKRPLLTSLWKVPPDVDETTEHQITVWRKFLSYFGLRESPESMPLKWNGGSTSRDPGIRIGLICGTENDPSKRWPPCHWRKLIERLLAFSSRVRVTLFGTANDLPITQTVARGFDPSRVENLAGKTDLVSFANTLLQCHLIFCNDTGGMHLANALGVPVVGIFGPTNPVRTGPIFDAPKYILQPPHCPETGGAPIAEVSPDVVFELGQQLIESVNPPNNNKTTVMDAPFKKDKIDLDDSESNRVNTKEINEKT